jgi:O-acetylserine/cysteine efflux transporter
LSAAPAHLAGRDYAAALGVVVIWGLNFIAMKFALHDFTPFQLGAARYLAASLPLVFFIRRPQIPWKWLLMYGLLQGVGQFGFLFWALQVGMTGALASVLMQTQVFFTAILGFALLHEKPGRPLRIGLALAALAMACFSINFVATQGLLARAVTVFGFVLSLCAAAMWAASNIVVRKLQQTGLAYDATGFVVWSSVAPVLPFVALSLLADPPEAHRNWTHAAASSWLSIAYLGWVATIAGYAMWTGLLKRHPANRVAPFSLGVPVVGLAAGILVLGESVSTWQWAGVALVVAALACVMFGDRRPFRR